MGVRRGTLGLPAIRRAGRRVSAGIGVIILAGGFGTRLQPLLGDVPKPLAPVAGRPFLEYILERLGRQGYRHVVLAAGHGAEQLQSHVGDGGRWGLEIEYSIEPQPLGTAGALRLATDGRDSPRWLVLNGDSLVDVPLGELVTAHASHGARASLALVRVDDTARYGAVELGQDGAIASFSEKNAAGGPGLINGGVYVLEREVPEGVPEAAFVSLERDVLPGLVGRGLYGVDYGDALFIDIGVPDDYRRAQVLLAEAG